MLAECFELLGGVSKVVLADRMGPLKGGVVANVVVPSPDYVRFATHYRFRPDFCHAQDPESKGIVENGVGYAKDDLLVPSSSRTRGPRVSQGSTPALAPDAGGQRQAAYGDPRHSRATAGRQQGLLGELPSLRLEGRPKPTTRKVNKLSCIRFGSVRYSVPNRLIGTTVTVLVDERDASCG